MKDEALRLALEFLESGNFVYPTSLSTAIKEALAQPAQEPVAWMRPSEEGYDSAFRDHSTVVACTGNPWTGWVPLYTTPPAAQPAQEPVAWICYGATGKRDIDFYEADIDKLPIGTQLYTTPQPRPWVGLTDEERDEILDSYLTAGGRARAIEAKLKEKNFD